LELGVLPQTPIKYHTIYLKKVSAFSFELFYIDPKLVAHDPPGMIVAFHAKQENPRYH